MTSASFADSIGQSWDVIDFWIPDGLHKKRLPLNARKAEGRAFVREGEPVRIYWFRGGINYQASDETTLGSQFGYAQVQQVRGGGPHLIRGSADATRPRSSR